jgi:peptidylamidoglycolate lyase
LKLVVNADSCCPLDQTIPINIFAARVHAHALGTVITAYKYDPQVLKHFQRIIDF